MCYMSVLFIVGGTIITGSENQWELHPKPYGLIFILSRTTPWLEPSVFCMFEIFFLKGETYSLERSFPIFLQFKLEFQYFLLPFKLSYNRHLQTPELSYPLYALIWLLFQLAAANSVFPSVPPTPNHMSRQ